MAVLNATDKLTAIEAVKRNGDNPDQRRIVEALAVTNQLLFDLPVFEANGVTVHTHLVRTKLPEGQHRTYNQGVESSSSQTKTVHDTMTQLMGYSDIDAKLVREAKDPAQFVMGECAAFLAGMGQQQAEEIIYSNNLTDPTQMNGFAGRRPKLGDNVVNMGGTGSNLTSIYLVKAGRDGVSYIYPKGASGIGISRQDRGIVDKTYDENGKTKLYEVYRNVFTADYGLSVGNEKALIRIANIDLTEANIGDKIVEKLLSETRHLPAGEGTIVAYMNADVLNAIDLSLAKKGNVNHTTEDPWGREVIKIRDIRLRQVDAILNTESALTA